MEELVLPPTTDASPPERPPHRRATALSIAVLGLLLFTWPFVRTPPLGIGESYAHLLGAWVTVVAALALLSQAIGRDARARGDRA